MAVSKLEFGRDQIKKWPVPMKQLIEEWLMLQKYPAFSFWRDFGHLHKLIINVRESHCEYSEAMSRIEIAAIFHTAQILKNLD